MIPQRAHASIIPSSTTQSLASKVPEIQASPLSLATQSSVAPQETVTTSTLRSRLPSVITAAKGTAALALTAGYLGYMRHNNIHPYEADGVRKGWVKRRSKYSKGSFSREDKKLLNDYIREIRKGSKIELDIIKARRQAEEGKEERSFVNEDDIEWADRFIAVVIKEMHVGLQVSTDLYMSSLELLESGCNEPGTVASSFPGEDPIDGYTHRWWIPQWMTWVHDELPARRSLTGNEQNVALVVSAQFEYVLGLVHLLREDDNAQVQLPVLNAEGNIRQLVTYSVLDELGCTINALFRFPDALNIFESTKEEFLKITRRSDQKPSLLKVIVHDEEWKNPSTTADDLSVMYQQSAYIFERADEEADNEFMALFTDQIYKSPNFDFRRDIQKPARTNTAQVDTRTGSGH